MGAVSHFLANYTGNFRTALMLWPLFSAMLTLPILAFLYHRDGRLRLGSAVGAYLAVLYVLGIGCFTLWPLPEGDAGPGITYGIPPQFAPLNFIQDIRNDGLKAVFQLAFNVVFFMPLGFIAGRLLRMRFVPTLLLALGTSCLVELAQLTGLFGIYPYAYRCCDVDDVAANTLGGVLGWLAAFGLRGILPSPQEPVGITHHPSFLQRCVALWIDLSLVGVGSLLLAGIVGSAGRMGFDAQGAVPGLDASQVDSLIAVAFPAVLFLIVEVLVPWCRDGSTPGGAFVRMSCEGKERTGGSRALFYALRSVTLGLLIFVPWIAVPVLALFYLFARKMPYDYLP